MIPPRVHFFLWLLSKNKLLTRDNLEKRRREDKTCLFCDEQETVQHLYYECVVAKRVWECISGVFGFAIGSDFESMTKCWLCNKKYGNFNIFAAAVCWALWKLRNCVCF
jgi:predicted GNAT superfamily acetyltransferase